PNMFFMVDDSGSMDSDLTSPETDEFTGVGGSVGFMPITAGAEYGYMYATDADDNAYAHGGTWGGVVPAQESVDTVGETDAFASLTGVWRARNSDYNKTYFNPLVTYEPWSGLDQSGTAYADADYSAAYFNPYTKAGTPSTINLGNTQSVDTRIPVLATSTLANFTFSYMPMRYWVWDDTDSSIPAAHRNNGEVDEDDKRTLVEITSSNG
ncbi:MAG: hypothetical protein GY942_19475, partial [Aestuariibacter sp.]|nr:hypothetical protein [Aestuariibacter sp.]